jgi:hypothetical protein
MPRLRGPTRQPRSWGTCGALLAALARLVLFHWLQPTVYLLGLAAFWSDLDPWQRAFASVVAAREVAYFGLTVVVCCAHPEFLLIDVPAGWARATYRGDATYRNGEQERANTIVYVAAPEKIALIVIHERAKRIFGLSFRADALFGQMLIALWISDLAGLGALLAALHSGVTHPPLIVGYIISLLAGAPHALAALSHGKLHHLNLY